MSDGVREDPWWASGSRPDDGLAGDEDPLDRHTSARRIGANGHGRGWWQDAVRALADEHDPHEHAAHDGARHDRAASADGTAHHDPDGRGVCHVCPVCIALRALDQSRPELVTHLSEALRHLSLAARAFVEAQVEATGGVDDGLQRVDLEDE